MNKEKKMTVLVIGNSGAGKTTLIQSIVGMKKEKSITKSIDAYESSELPIRFIDSKGFEYSLLEQLKTIWQIRKFSRKSLKSKKEDKQELGIDAVWYCIEGTARRSFDYNIKLMNKAIKGWKNIPIFVVITKSYSEKDIEQNVSEIEKLMKDNKKINLKKIIPIVAEEYIVNNEVTVEPKGIEELCIETLDCYEEAKNTNKDNRQRFILNQKRFEAHGSVITAAGIAAGIAFVDRGNKADAAILTPLEMVLTKLIFRIYNVKYTNSLVKKTIGGSAITSFAKYIVGKFDKSHIQIVDTIVAGSVVFLVGEAVIAASEASYKGLIDLDGIAEFVEKRIENSPFAGKVVKYLKENKDRLSDLDAKEVVTEFKKFLDSNKEIQQTA